MPVPIVDSSSREVMAASVFSAGVGVASVIGCSGAESGSVFIGVFSDTEALSHTIQNGQRVHTRRPSVRD